VIRLGAALGFVGVALGAFGAHGLKARLGPGMLDVYKTGVLYQLIHALAVLAVGLGADRLARPRAVAARAPGWVFQAGIALFSGSLYALALTDVKALGAITPIGGVAFLVGWIWLAVAVLQRGSA